MARAGAGGTRPTAELWTERPAEPERRGRPALSGGADAEARSQFEAALGTARNWLDAARRVVVLCGAGISTDSGIPDFRGPDGLWTRNPEAEKQATIQYYMSDPAVRERAWRERFYREIEAAEPNAGHRALLALEARGVLSALITQNVDGLHHKAGHDPRRVIEIHGTLREVVCMACGDRGPLAATLERVGAGEEDPPCRRCGGILKTATISFGQALVEADLARCWREALRCDLLLAVGTTLAVYPVAEVVPMAKRSGARIVIVNGSATEMDDLADALLRGRLGDLLPRLLGARPALD